MPRTGPRGDRRASDRGRDPDRAREDNEVRQWTGGRRDDTTDPSTVRRARRGGDGGTDPDPSTGGARGASDGRERQRVDRQMSRTVGGDTTDPSTVRRARRGGGGGTDDRPPRTDRVGADPVRRVDQPDDTGVEPVDPDQRGAARAVRRDQRATPDDPDPVVVDRGSNQVEPADRSVGPADDVQPAAPDGDISLPAVADTAESVASATPAAQVAARAPDDPVESFQEFGDRGRAAFYDRVRGGVEGATGVDLPSARETRQAPTDAVSDAVGFPVREEFERARGAAARATLNTANAALLATSAPRQAIGDVTGETPSVGETLAGVAVAGAVAEPTPLGEAALLGAGAVGAIGADVARRAGQDADGPVTPTDGSTTTLGVPTDGTPTQDQGELSVPADGSGPRADEIQVPSDARPSVSQPEVPVDGTTDTTIGLPELSVPSGGSAFDETGRPGVFRTNQLIGRQEGRQRIRDREGVLSGVTGGANQQERREILSGPDETVTLGDDPASVSDDGGQVSDPQQSDLRRAFERERDFGPGRVFPTGEQAVVGRSVDQSAAEPQVSPVTDAPAQRSDAAEPSVDPGVRAGGSDPPTSVGVGGGSDQPELTTRDELGTPVTPAPTFDAPQSDDLNAVPEFGDVGSDAFVPQLDTQSQAPSTPAGLAPTATGETPDVSSAVTPASIAETGVDVGARSFTDVDQTPVQAVDQPPRLSQTPTTTRRLVEPEQFDSPTVNPPRTGEGPAFVNPSGFAQPSLPRRDEDFDPDDDDDDRLDGFSLFGNAFSTNVSNLGSGFLSGFDNG